MNCEEIRQIKVKLNLNEFNVLKEANEILDELVEVLNEQDDDTEITIESVDEDLLEKIRINMHIIGDYLDV